MRFLALAGFPLSLVSAGATVSMALVAVFGLALLWRQRDMPADLYLAHRMMFALYLFLLLVDLLNGGGPGKLVATAVNYLPLVALAPYAYALRRLSFRPGTLDTTIELTVALGIVTPALLAIFFAQDRPGGLDMDALSYGIVLIIWTLFVFSRALDASRGGAIFLLGLAALSFLTVVSSRTRIVIAGMLLGFLIIAVQWAWSYRRWRAFVLGLLTAAILGAFLLYNTDTTRLTQLADEMVLFLGAGQMLDGSIGIRLGQIVAGWQAFLEAPLLGHGLVEMGAAVRAHSPANGPDISWVILHNDFISHMVAFGICGLAFLAAYFVVSLVLISRSGNASNRRAGVALVLIMPVLMTAYIIFNMSPMTGAVTLAMGVVLSARRQVPAGPTAP